MLYSKGRRMAAPISVITVMFGVLVANVATAQTDRPLRVSQGQFVSLEDQSAFEKSVSKALSGKVQLINPADHPANGDGEGGDLFGCTVAISGETAVVGAYLDAHATSNAEGSAYVFVRSGSQWALQAKLVAPDGAFSDQFGFAVALSGDTALVSAPGTSHGGAAYVFVRSGQTWSMQAKLVGTDTSWGHRFGSDVALDGDIAAVGAPGRYDGSLVEVGTTYVFARTGTLWTQKDQLFAPTAVELSRFGQSVAVSGGSLIVGAPSGGHIGFAYVYAQAGADWNWQSTLPMPDGEAGDAFGYSVAISGNTAAVGAKLDDTAMQADVGSVSIYVRNGSTWTWQAKLEPGDGDNYHEFGHDIALSGTTVVVGSHWFGAPQTHRSGAAYIYAWDGSTWALQGKLQPAGFESGDQFGASVAISGESFLAGAPFDDTVAGGNAGTAGVFVRDAGIWTQQAQLSAGNGAAEHRFGWSVALSGSTALVAAPNADAPGAAHAGVVYVFVRNGDAWTQQAQLTAGDAEEFAEFGASVALEADTAIVGSPLKDGSLPEYFRPDVGAVYVYERNGSNWVQQAKLTASDGETDDEFGNSVAISDGTILVGAWREGSTITTREGSAYVFVRNGATWSQQAKLVAPDAEAGDALGWAVALSDNTALVSARTGGSPTNPGTGSAYVFTRSGMMWAWQAELTADDVEVQDGFGRSVSVSGDIAMVGAPSARNPMADASGAVYVFLRSGSNWSAPSRLVSNAPISGESFGHSVSLAGDVALIGAPAYTFSGTGAAYLFVRQGAVWSQDGRIAGDETTDAFGASVATSGDTQLIGAPNFSNSVSQNPNVGAAYFARQALFVDGFE
ncbi:MAG: hypothetical protein HYV17_14790 [Xanthomonadales bacterium]|nr:hypothetical protein [Xanthomonadales bacterium]